MSKKYSVLMSLYYKEQAKYLEQSLESMFQQTVLPDEIILVKDGPLTSELEDVLAHYKSKYPKMFKLIALEKNVGLGKALDIGLDRCSNELVARMDTDDISLPNRCERQLQTFANDPELALVGTMIDEFIDDPTKIVSSRIVPTDHKQIKQFIKRRNAFNHPTVMFKKTVVKKAGGYGELRRRQDIDLFSRIISKGYKTMNIDEALLLFRSNEENYKRRKSWRSCWDTIRAHYSMLQKGNCSFVDLLFVTISQLFMFVSPMWLVKRVSKKFLRVKR